MEVRPFNIKIDGNKIILTGDIDGSPKILELCQKVLGNKNNLCDSKLIIDAYYTRIVPEGVEIWIELVKTFLSDYELVYVPSQLAFVLQFDDTYYHKKTIFLEEMEELASSANSVHCVNHQVLNYI